MNLKNVSTADLKKELQKRKQELEERKLNAPPVLDEIDWDTVKDDAIRRRDEVINDKLREENDDAQYIFEDVMKAVFGDGYFDWENQHTS